MSRFARSAPAIFPMPYHRSMAEVMAEEWREEAGKNGGKKASANRQKYLPVRNLFSIKEAGQNSVCTAEPALTNNRLAVGGD